jgi:hypothetical protein
VKLNGILAPTGEGLIVEVHVDLIDPSPSFRDYLHAQGFEEDPFSIFFPAEYNCHMTGRTRHSQKEPNLTIESVRRLVRRLVNEGKGECGFYVETELVRDVARFCGVLGEVSRTGDALDDVQFFATGRHGEAKADVHVEFPLGQVSEEIRRYLTSRQFYWVQAPSTTHFGPEEIATLQTETYASAVTVFQKLRAHPLPGCTAVHLEQKLGMSASRSGLPMPEVIMVHV